MEPLLAPRSFHPRAIRDIDSSDRANNFFFKLPADKCAPLVSRPIINASRAMKDVSFRPVSRAFQLQFHFNGNSARLPAQLPLNRPILERSARSYPQQR